MKKDFHYGVIRVLAEKAGFTPAQSQLVAYASQYVDDAIYHEKISVKNIEDLDIPDLEKRISAQDSTFDPICTAHSVVGHFLAGKKVETHRKIYIPFHFLPPNKLEEGKEFNYSCEPKGKMATELVDSAINKLLEVDGKTEENFIELGVTLHSFADTWAHAEFAGRLCNKSNDLEQVYRIDNNNINYLVSTEPLPNIGHADAADYPDRSELTWGYNHDPKHYPNSHSKKRYNSDYFLKAAKVIFSKLCDVTGKKKNTFQNFEEKLLKCLTHKHTSPMLEDVFSEISFEYDKGKWMRNGLRPLLGEYGVYDYDFELLEDHKWFYFHAAALRQRRFVVGNVPFGLD